MARRVFFHVGTLKTGTTYLQRVTWKNRDALRAAGVLVAGTDYRDRVWAAETVRDMPPPHELAATAWDRIRAQVEEFDGDALISHEFFGSASTEQAQRALADLQPAEVHIVCTARDLAKVFPALWQEVVKFRHAGSFADYEPGGLDAKPNQHWSWRTIDVADVLRRWGAGLPAQHVHVVTVPKPGAPRDLLWQRFAEACQFDPAIADLDVPPVNESMGVAETELLRRVNPRLGEDLTRRGETARWVRGYLALEVLARRSGERFGVDADRAARLRQRSLDIVEQLGDADYHVVGDLDDLVGEEDASTTRAPEDVEAGELLDVALDVISQMLSDYRRVSLQRDKARNELKTKRGQAAPRSRWSVLRHLGRAWRAARRLRADARRQDGPMR